jgi:hypothetical protein
MLQLIKKLDQPGPDFLDHSFWIHRHFSAPKLEPPSPWATGQS